jgi:predicted  nucleic acid-binding Zn-ribbon protein
MSLPAELHKLQQLDIELEKRRQTIDEITRQLSENKALAAVESQLASRKQQLHETGNRQKDVEWDLQDLEEKINSLDAKLYGGTVSNPKELVNLKQEVDSLKKKSRTKEDELLELMGQTEELQAKVEASCTEFQELEQEWQQKRQALTASKAEAETELASLTSSRHGLSQEIGTEALKLYELIKSSKGQAIAKVEQGRCQGCYIALPMGQWQKARAGELVQCSSCSRILYVE